MTLIKSVNKKTLINLDQVQTITISDNDIMYEFQPGSTELNGFREKFKSPEEAQSRFDFLSEFIAHEPI